MKGALNKSKILIIDDEKDFGWLFSDILGKSEYEVISSRTGKDGLDKVGKFIPDLVFLDLKLPDINGEVVLKEIKKVNPDILVIIVTAYETIQTAVSSMKWGAYDYIPKPIPNDRLKIIVEKALETQRLSRQVDFLTKGNITPNNIIGRSQPMQEFFKLVKSAAVYDISVILKGESGTGKELAARAMHILSKRKDNPFVAVDCATLPEALVESELFGYEKGAFTGADGFKPGKFEQAQGGTLFLDEIGNLTNHIQVKLLRVIQERKIERLGGRNPIKIDVRIISATNRDLEEAVRVGQFRDDLYHRLQVFEIMLPPLRKRGDDVIFISQYFLDRFNKEMDKSIRGFSGEVLEIFKRYPWPGNVRELENTVRSSVILAKDIILPEHLSFQIKRNIEDTNKGDNSAGIEFSHERQNFEKMPLKAIKKKLIEETEKRLIEKVLMETNWNKKKTARILEIDYKSLFIKIKKYEISRV